MADQQTIEFFNGVLSKTRAGKIPWKPTAEDSNFIATIGGQYVLSVSAYDVEAPLAEVPQPRYALVLRDRNGDELTTVTDTDQEISANEIQELYETARRKAIRVDEKIGGQYVLSVSAYDLEAALAEVPQPRYALVLRDRNGDELTTVTDTDQEISANEIQELYETARRKSLPGDEKIGGALEVLSRL